MANELPQYGSFQPEIQDISRQRELSKMLLQQGLQGNLKGQMVGNIYVPSHPLEGLADIYSAYKGRQLAKEADTKQAELAKQLRDLKVQETESIMEAITGRPAQSEILATEQNVPQGQTVIDNEGNPTLVQAARPELKASPQLALARALKAETSAGSALLPSLISNAIPKPLDIEREYQLAQRDGYKGKFTDYLKYKENLKDIQPSFTTVEADGGIYTLNSRTGKLTPAVDATGKPLTGKNELTEYQGKATNYGIQMANSAKEMKSLEDSGYNPSSFKNQSGIASAGTTAGNLMVSPETQRYRQAMDNFANAYIRFQSGANVPEQEIKRNLENLMPAMGDSEEKLKQKARARASALEGIRISAGRGAKRIPEINIAAPAANIPMPTNKPIPKTAPAGVDPNVWKFMTDAEKALWGG